MYNLDLIPAELYMFHIIYIYIESHNPCSRKVFELSYNRTLKVLLLLLLLSSSLLLFFLLFCYHYLLLFLMKI